MVKRSRFLLLMMLLVSCVMIPGTGTIRQIMTKQLDSSTNSFQQQDSEQHPESDSLFSPVEGKIAYLTFDDGPSANTDLILNILKRYGVQATFYVNGRQSEEAKRLYRRIHAEGHVLGNHTYSHNYATIYSSVEAFVKDTERLNKLLEETTGQRPELLRFPGGSNNHVSHRYGGNDIMRKIINEIEHEGYVYTDWNVSSTDAAFPVQAKDDIIQTVLNGCHGKQEAIVLMHDDAAKKSTLEALPFIIEGLQTQGFQFAAQGKRTFHCQFLKL